MKSGFVRRMRVELTRACAHYPLKVACLPFHHLRVVTCKSISNVPKTGLEPAHLTAHAPETCASTNSATWALNQNWYSCLNTNYWLLVERKTGFEPATPTLARSCSTTELFPQVLAKINVFFKSGKNRNKNRWKIFIFDFNKALKTQWIDFLETWRRSCSSFLFLR